MKRIIAIDGPAASGKGTLARKLAAHMNYAHMDTGALYRAVGYIVQQKSLDPIPAAKEFCANFSPEQLENPALRLDETGQAASKVAAIPQVREALLQLQKDFAYHPGAHYKGAVLDGRDIGTVIAPDAPVKIFIIADDKIRAERRTKELQSKGLDVTYEAVLKDMRERDARDKERQSAPMRAASDAFILDTSDLTAEQVFEKALEFVSTKIIPKAIL